MPLLARTLFAPLAFDVRPGALGQLRQILSERSVDVHARTLVVVGPGVGHQVRDIVHTSLPAATVLPVIGGTMRAAKALARTLRDGHYGLAIGVGGGRIIDTVKYAAGREGVPMVSVATSLAHDGIASPVSVLQRRGRSVSLGTHIPVATIVDIDFVLRSPVQQTRSGIGDVVSNLCAVADWELDHQVNGAVLDGLAVSLAGTAAQAVLTHPGDLKDADFVTTLAHSLMLSGVAMSIAGSSRPCSGGCHEIAHALTALYPGSGTHGEQVALGALFCTWLRGDRRLFNDLYATLRRHGLPCRPADLGLTAEQFAEAVTLAPRTRPGRYTILEHLDLDPSAIAGRLTDYLDDLHDMTNRSTE
ncbi:iron-containing alcohol dehydrogenase family protein [Planosporangium sp. 12N6]|uniref:iron-containing alcohol dehydrogenase family protein n=1 Tax=Planosporangium spinosum TaxID=3402278 RepID=UPI003CF5D8DA